MGALHSLYRPCRRTTSSRRDALYPPNGMVVAMYLITWAITTNKIIAGIVVLAIIAVGAGIFYRRRGQNPIQ